MKDRAPLAFAGLWERWSAPSGGVEALETFAILTAAANEIVALIHHRMPVILTSAAFDLWLAGAEVALGPYPPEAMTAWTVSTYVNRPRTTIHAASSRPSSGDSGAPLSRAATMPSVISGIDFRRAATPLLNHRGDDTAIRARCGPMHSWPPATAKAMG